MTRRSGKSEFTLDDASVDGRGLRPEFRDAGWEQIWHAIYQQSVVDEGGAPPSISSPG